MGHCPTRVTTLCVSANIEVGIFVTSDHNQISCLMSRSMAATQPEQGQCLTLGNLMENTAMTKVWTLDVLATEIVLQVLKSCFLIVPSSFQVLNKILFIYQHRNNALKIFPNKNLVIFKSARISITLRTFLNATWHKSFIDLGWRKQRSCCVVKIAWTSLQDPQIIGAAAGVWLQRSVIIIILKWRQATSGGCC